MKNLKKIIISIVILIVALFIGIISIKIISKKYGETIEDDNVKQDILIQPNEDIHKEDNDYIFFTNEELINKLINNVDNQEGMIKNVMEIKSEQEKQQIETVLRNMEKFYAQEEYVQNDTLVDVYYVKGFVKNKNRNELSTQYFQICVDNENQAYLIKMLEEEEYNDIIKNNEKLTSKITIERNKYNEYQVKNLSTMSLVNNYIEDFKLKLQYNKKLAYSILDEEAKTKNFGNEKQFEQFINENKETYYNIE